MVPFVNKGSPFSLFLSPLFEPHFCIQLSDVVMEIFLDFSEKAKHEEDFVMHEQWSKDECYSKRHYIRSRIADTGKILTSEQVIQQCRGAALVYTMSIELSEPAENVDGRSDPQRTGLGCVRSRS